MSEPIANGQLQRVLLNWTLKEETLYMQCLSQPGASQFCKFALHPPTPSPFLGEGGAGLKSLSQSGRGI
ncbi:MAG: hypothetical protein HC879_17710 [Leptolyngbyaceae cyanobacterium SL_5_9]|nr:hypothetical protein [Leptolyngbyaceae cyanobacterium SL_5_9]